MTWGGVDSSLVSTCWVLPFLWDRLRAGGPLKLFGLGVNNRLDTEEVLIYPKGRWVWGPEEGGSGENTLDSYYGDSGEQHE